MMARQKPRLPRGIRNNNPGNIRLSSQRWLGQKTFQFDPDFIEFETPLMGLRALMKLLLNYYSKFGLNTVESIINRYAPPHENATDGYIGSVCKAMAVKRRDALDLNKDATLILLVKAICQHENGMPKNGQWYADTLFAKAATAARAK
jgi:hypothetical protein